MIELKPWTLPLIVAALVVPAAAGFIVGGPPVGLGVGFQTVATVALVAVRQSPRETIETAAGDDEHRRVLVVVSRELDDPESIERVTRETGLGDAGEVVVLAPAQTSLLDRWASDVRRSRAEAQRKLVLSVASLGKANVAATATVGDEGIVQAVEDRLRDFPANEVVLVTGTPEDDVNGDRAAKELAERLSQPLSRFVVDR
jgi:hypothetical protein